MKPSYNELTPERLACLRVIADSPTGMSHDEGALSPFCDDESTQTHPDVFNQCHKGGWLKSWYDGQLDCSFVELTAKGIAALKTALGEK